MSNEKMTVAEFAGKVEWEGGLYEAVAGYGLRTTDLDESAPIELIDLLRTYEVLAEEMQGLGDRIEELLQEALEEAMEDDE